MIVAPSYQLRTVTIREALREAADHYHAGRYDEAQRICDQLLQQRPGNADALHMLGVLAIKRGKLNDAVPYFEQALALQAKNPEFHANFGSLLSELKRYEDAMAELRRAIELKPGYGEAHLNLATVLLEQGRFGEALSEFRHTLQLNPKLLDAHTGLGCAESHFLRIPEAIAAFRLAIAGNADNVAAHCNLSMMLLCAGAFEEGWKEYEWRFRSKNWGTRKFRQPRWQGEPLQGKTLLIPCEQGLGDTIQFIRYLPTLKKLGAKIVFECRQELKNLFKDHRYINLLIDWPKASDVTGGVDCYVPLMSVPLHFGTRLDSIPTSVPYITADPAVVEAWRPRLAASGLKVGLVWSGNPQHLMDRYRSCSLPEMAALAEVPNATFYVLQKGPASAQAKEPPPGMKLVNLSEDLTDFSQTAAVISQLDLVLTVDTSVAHLAGAMGQAVWTLLPHSPDWRWMLDRDDSPWYPTMRHFRQKSNRDWRELMGRVVAAMRELRPNAGAAQIYSPPSPLNDAYRAYQDGNRAAAEQRCRQILEQQRYHVDALALLGGILFQDNRFADAIDSFERYLRLRPGDAMQHFNLGVCLNHIGQREEAIASYRRALAIDPANPEVHFNLANGLRDAGQTQEAIEHFRQAITAKPGYRKARINLGNLLRREGRADQAMAEYWAVLESDASNARAHHGLALSFLDQGDYPAALPHAQQAAVADSNSPEVHNTLGTALQENDQLSEAQASFKRAVALRPNYIEALANLAGNLARQGQIAAGEEALTHAMAQPARSPEACVVLARVALTGFRRVDQALALVRECLQARPEWPEIHYDLGSLLLYQGQLAEGYAEYEWRERVRSTVPLDLAEPKWTGGDLTGKTILLYTEQGFGDAIHMARFVPLVQKLGTAVVIGCSAPLVPLFAAIPGVLAASDKVAELPRFDLRASFLSLPHLLGTTLATLPSEVPYLRAPTTLSIPSPGLDRQLKVGIVWKGNSKFKDNRQRSCGFGLFRELTERHPTIAFYSLQAGESDVAVPSKIVDLAPLLADWGATAAVLEQLDLVITVDTGVAHLAGALGKPVWTLLAYLPDPRWLLDRDDSPWYPTMRLFRQERHGDWQDVLRRVDEALAIYRDPEPLITNA